MLTTFLYMPGRSASSVIAKQKKKKKKKKKKKPTKQKTLLSLRRAPRGQLDNWPKLTAAVTRLRQQVSCIKSGSPLPVSRTSFAFLQVFFARHGQKKKNRDSERRSCHSSGCPVTRGCRPGQKTGEALAARTCLPDCRPSPDQRHNTRSGGTLVHSADDDERVTHPPPAASFRGNRQRKSTNKEEEDEEGDRSTQQKFFYWFLYCRPFTLYS